MEIGTFSIIAYDENENAFGAAVCSKSLAVGSRVPWAKPNVGVIATQAFTNVKYGSEGLKLMERGFTAQETLDLLLEKDPRREERQVGMIDKYRNIAVHTGKFCIDWAGHKVSKNFAVLGNLIVGEVVLEKMKYAFEVTDGLLSDRLLAAIEAGFIAGGDKRGHSSAAILVVKEPSEEYSFNEKFIDLRIDHHKDPIGELKRIYSIFRKQYIL